MLLADRAGTVWVCAVDTGRPAYPPFRHPAPLSRTAIGPDGRHVLTIGAYRANLWRLEDGRVDRLWQEEGALGAAISPDGRLVATAGRDGTVRVRDIRTAEPIAAAPSAPKSDSTPPPSARTVNAS